MGFTENDITGEVLVALLHDDLKGIGVNSVGHRLTILKSVYDIKVKQDIPIETDNYVPLCEYTPDVGFCASILIISSGGCGSSVCNSDIERYTATCGAITTAR